MFLARGSRAQAAFSLCVVSPDCHRLARMSCYSLVLSTFPSEPDNLHSNNRTRVWVEVNSTEVTTLTFQERKHWIDSGEDIASTPSVSEVHERSDLGMMASPLLSKERERTLHESCLQLQSQRMELYQMNQLSDHSQREKSWLCTEFDRTERFLR